MSATSVLPINPTNRYQTMTGFVPLSLSTKGVHLSLSGTIPTDLQTGASVRWFHGLDRFGQCLTLDPRSSETPIPRRWFKSIRLRRELAD
jgi:hypothetical protein